MVWKGLSQLCSLFALISFSEFVFHQETSSCACFCFVSCYHFLCLTPSEDDSYHFSKLLKMEKTFLQWMIGLFFVLFFLCFLFVLFCFLLFSRPFFCCVTLQIHIHIRFHWPWIKLILRLFVTDWRCWASQQWWTESGTVSGSWSTSSFCSSTSWVVAAVSMGATPGTGTWLRVCWSRLAPTACLSSWGHGMPRTKFSSCFWSGRSLFSGERSCLAEREGGGGVGWGQKWI